MYYDRKETVIEYNNNAEKDGTKIYDGKRLELAKSKKLVKWSKLFNKQ